MNGLTWKICFPPQKYSKTFLLQSTLRFFFFSILCWAINPLEKFPPTRITVEHIFHGEQNFYFILYLKENMTQGGKLISWWEPWWTFMFRFQYRKDDKDIGGISDRCGTCSWNWIIILLNDLYVDKYPYWLNFFYAFSFCDNNSFSIQLFLFIFKLIFNFFSLLKYLFFPFIHRFNAKRSGL